MSKQTNPGWVLVESSAVAALAYDEGTESLYVRFKPSGTEYCYANVTVSEHAALVSAESIGKHFNAHIKPTHTFVKLGDDAT